MQVIGNIGELSFLISRIALITRQFQNSKTNKYANYDTAEDFQQILNETIIQQSNLLTDYASWSDCKGSQSINQDVIPYITFENPFVVKYTNLYSFVGDIIYNVIKYVDWNILK